MEEFIDSLMYDYEPEEIENEEEWGEIDKQVDEMILNRIQKEEEEATWILIDEDENKYIYQAKDNEHFYKEVSKNGSCWSTYKKYE